MMACLKHRLHSESHQGIFFLSIFSFFSYAFLFLASFTCPVAFIISLVASFGQDSLWGVRTKDSGLSLLTAVTSFFPLVISNSNTNPNLALTLHHGISLSTLQNLGKLYDFPNILHSSEFHQVLLTRNQHLIRFLGTNQQIL